MRRGLLPALLCCRFTGPLLHTFFPSRVIFQSAPHKLIKKPASPVRFTIRYALPLASLSSKSLPYALMSWPGAKVRGREEDDDGGLGGGGGGGGLPGRPRCCLPGRTPAWGA